MHTYPIRLEGRLDPGLSRWQWLVKWLLAIPHYAILAFLLLAFAVLTVVAGFAIVFTGRYPRSIFAFNVGVMRWTWRVNYYTCSALGTDRYPPFTLAETDYPASLDVAFPQRRSRGLALVKWWLLAIPHYLVVAVFAGGGSWLAWNTNNGDVAVYGNLIGLLALIAVVILAVTGHNPRSLFDLLLGLHRWVLRVAAYAGLMTDQYPPFRLDLGGHEPDAGAAGPLPPDTRR